MNILANAIDALQDDETISTPKIDITTTLQIDQVMIAMRDNGPGIPASVQSTIFDPFFTTKPVGKGTGLGLSISHSIIDGHGGTLVCRSSIGEGTEFTITLPTEAP